jgi:hypothetical protein
MEIRLGISDPGSIKQRTDPAGETHPDSRNGLINTVARFEVARLNQGQPVYARVAMEYVDNNAYDMKANPEAVDYDMWDFCFIHSCSFWKPNQQHPHRLSERTQAWKGYEYLVNKVQRRARMDISALPPRAWPEICLF